MDHIHQLEMAKQQQEAAAEQAANQPKPTEGE